MRANVSLRVLVLTAITMFPAISYTSSIIMVDVPVNGQDAAEAIQHAIDTCAEGGEVRLRPGTYSLSRTLRLRSHITLSGNTKETTVLAFKGTEPGVILDLSGCEQVVIAEVTLDGADNPNATQGVYATNARHLTLRHLIIGNLVGNGGFGPHGILFSGENSTGLKGVTDSLVEACRIERIGLDAPFGCGIRFSWGSSHNRAVDSHIEDTGRGGIFGDNGSTRLTIQRNTVRGSRGEGLGIEVWGGSDYAIIEDNDIDHWLSIGHSSHCAIRRNTISSATGTHKFCGIEAIGAHLIITDNAVNGGQSIGLSVSNNTPKNFMYIANNTFRNCNQWGAQVQGEADGAAYHYYYNCLFADMPVGHANPPYPGAEGHGFRFNGNAHRITFEACSFVNNARSGMQAVGENITRLRFMDCVFQRNLGAAFSGFDSLAEVTLENCVIEGNKADTLPALTPWVGKSPGADFEITGPVTAGKELQIKSTSRPSEGTIIAMLWDFGEGLPETGNDPVHVFRRTGPHTVTLIVWDEHGHAGRCAQHVEVLPAEG